MTKKGLLGGLAAAGGATVTFFCGYYLAKLRLEEHYQHIAATEITEAKEFYKSFYKKDEYDTPEKAANELLPEAVEALENYQPTDETPDDVKKVVEDPKDHEGQDLEELAKAADHLVEEGKKKTKNIFTPPEDVTVDFNEGKVEEKPPTTKKPRKKKPAADEAKAATKTVPPPRIDVNDNFPTPIQIQPDKIFIISQDVFMSNDTGYEQQTMTFFTGDKILVNSEDQIINEVYDWLGGEENIRFGHRSDDPNVVYIRNIKMGTDIELLRHEGTYKEVVAGLGGDDG